MDTAPRFYHYGIFVIHTQNSSTRSPSEQGQYLQVCHYISQTVDPPTLTAAPSTKLSIFSNVVLHLFQ